MPQPSLFEATCISVGAVSQELLAGAMIPKAPGGFAKRQGRLIINALFSESIGRMSILQEWKGG